MGGQTMTEYRIAEIHRRFHIEYRDDKVWKVYDEVRVPRFFDTLANARSWVATIKRGVVYHDAEDAPNLPVDERKAGDDTSDGIKPLEWFVERVGKDIHRTHKGICFPVAVDSKDHAYIFFANQNVFDLRYSDPR
jgi:hypothetical protein